MIQGLRRPNDRCKAFKRLKEHHKGVICEVNKLIKSLFHAGEKPPHMWWMEFEKRLTCTLNANVKREDWIVHSDSLKIKMHFNKIKADFLLPTNAQLEIDLS
jgi:hypothetical protein